MFLFPKVQYFARVTIWVWTPILYFFQYYGIREAIQPVISAFSNDMQLTKEQITNFSLLIAIFPTFWLCYKVIHGETRLRQIMKSVLNEIQEIVEESTVDNSENPGGELTEEKKLVLIEKISAYDDFHSAVMKIDPQEEMDFAAAARLAGNNSTARRYLNSAMKIYIGFYKLRIWIFPA